MTAGRRFLRDNIFLVAAVSLPLLVVVFFVASSAIPRWLVPPPAYDLLIRGTDVYNQTNPRVSVDFNEHDGKVEATFRPVQANAYQSRSVLFVFDHTTLTAREIPVELPNDLAEGDPPRRVVVDALAGRKLLVQARAPDGYELESRSRGGPGIVGEVFGMHRYDSSASLVNKGRVITIALPPPFQNIYSPVSAIGWLVPENNGQP